MRRFLVIGTGRLAFDCARLIREAGEYPEICEYAAYLEYWLQARCAGADFPYARTDDIALAARLDALPSSSIVVSASNLYIFPRRITDRQDLTLINYHAALLPHHPGRNPEAWSIFDQDKETGATWHLVTSEVDGGPILAAESFPITDNTTSLRLMSLLTKCGAKLFGDILPSLLSGKYSSREQEGARGEIHYGYDIPAGGVLDISWQGAKISAFLRCMDYGKLDVLGRPSACLNGTKYIWDSYRVNADDVPEKTPPDTYAFRKDGFLFQFKGWRPVETK
jgi:methionyl-tRNA formyltransferase